MWFGEFLEKNLQTGGSFSTRFPETPFPKWYLEGTSKTRGGLRSERALERPDFVGRWRQASGRSGKAPVSLAAKGPKRRKGGVIGGGVIWGGDGEGDGGGGDG